LWDEALPIEARRVAAARRPSCLISLADPDARPIGSAKLDKPTQFGYVAQIVEITPNTRRGAHGRIVPAASLPDDPAEHAAAPNVTKLNRLGLAPKEVALDGGFMLAATNDALSNLAPQRVFIAGRQQPGSGAPNDACSAAAPTQKNASATSNAAIYGAAERR
jgi:hypothetical protein